MEPIASNDEVRSAARRPLRGLGPILPGLLVLVLGIVFLLDNLDVVESGRIFRFWPVILIAVGVKHLWEARDRGTALSGTLLAGAGALLLLDTLGVIRFNVWELWPVILIAVGFRMLTRARSDPAASAGATESDETCHAFLGTGRGDEAARPGRDGSDGRARDQELKRARGN